VNSHALNYYSLVLNTARFVDKQKAEVNQETSIQRDVDAKSRDNETIWQFPSAKENETYLCSIRDGNICSSSRSDKCGILSMTGAYNNGNKDSPATAIDADFVVGNATRIHSNSTLDSYVIDSSLRCYALNCR
jgi:hypothetical protein